MLSFAAFGRRKFQLSSISLYTIRHLKRFLIVSQICVHLAVVCLGKRKVQFWGGSSHAYAFFFLAMFKFLGDSKFGAQERQICFWPSCRKTSVFLFVVLGLWKRSACHSQHVQWFWDAALIRTIIGVENWIIPAEWHAKNGFTWLEPVMRNG